MEINNISIKYTFKGKILTPDELEQNKMFFDSRVFGSHEKTSAIIKLKESTMSGKHSILYIDEDFNLKSELNIGI